MKAAARSPRVRKSSGNVFADLRIPQAQDALAKAKLAHRICKVIAERDLTQKEAADVLGVDQPKISDLMRGKLDGFSAERLFRFLNDLGQEVEIFIRPVQRTGRKGNIHIIASDQCKTR